MQRSDNWLQALQCQYQAKAAVQLARVRVRDNATNVKALEVEINEARITASYQNALTSNVTLQMPMEGAGTFCETLESLRHELRWSAIMGHQWLYLSAVRLRISPRG